MLFHCYHHVSEQTEIDAPLFIKFSQRVLKFYSMVIRLYLKLLGIPLPKQGSPMPPSEIVHKVQLLPRSSEDQDVLRKMQATTGTINVQKIERVQNSHLYQSYMVRKQKMDKDTGGSSERQLFHGADAKNVGHINTQEFNRSFFGVHGECEREELV